MSTENRREKEKQQRRIDIIEAAKEIFFSKGLQSATMDEIAEKAELSKGTLYLYFKSKEDLYVSLLEEGSKIFFEYLQKAVSARYNAARQMKNLMNAFYKFYYEHRHFYDILFSIQKGEIPREKISEDVYKTVQNNAMDLLNFVKDIIKKGIDKGEFRNVNPWQMTLTSWGAATGMLSISGIMGFHRLGEIEGKKLLDFTTNMLLNGLKNG